MNSDGLYEGGIPFLPFLAILFASFSCYKGLDGMEASSASFSSFNSVTECVTLGSDLNVTGLGYQGGGEVAFPKIANR